MSITLEILKHLWNTDLNYKGSRVNAFGIPKSLRFKEQSIRSTMSRLHKREFVSKSSGSWVITESGKKYLTIKNSKSLNRFDSPFKLSSPKNLLLMFDVPESRKAERKWLRLHLTKFKYIMIQKSVWVGPSPLPKEFLSYLKEIKLNECIKTFKLAKSYEINKSNN